MDRRDFLKMAGLGGLSLTLPKPLSILAARASDLQDPPIHAGMVRFRNLADFNLYDFRLGLDREVPVTEALNRAYDDWMVHVLIRRDEKSYIPILEARVSNYLNHPAFTQADFLHPAFTQVDFLHPARLGGLNPNCTFNFMSQDTLEVWIVPKGKPKLCLSHLWAVLYGPPRGPFSDPSGLLVAPGYAPSDLRALPIRAVRLERDRAIEMGLALPSDVFEAL